MKDISEIDVSKQFSEKSRAPTRLAERRTIRSRSLKMSPSPHTPSTPRVFQKRIRVLIMSLVQTGEQRNAVRQERTESRREMVTLITVEPGTPAGFYISLCFSLFPSTLVHVPAFFFISASRLCLTSVAKFFRPATIIAPWRSRRWRRKTGFGLRLSCLRICRDATHQHVIRRESVRKNHILDERSSDVSPKLEPYIIVLKEKQEQN